MTSFRSHIRLSTLALIVALLATFNIGVYWGFVSVLHQYVDTRLQAIAEFWGDIVEKNSAKLFQFVDPNPSAADPPPAGGEEQLALREAALSIRVLSLDGTVVWKGDAAIVRPPVKPGVLAKVAQGGLVFDTISSLDGVPIRRISVPTRQDGQVRYVLQAETSLRLMENALNGLLVSLAVASGAILGLAWFGSGWLARKALTPVEMLSETAQTISESSLGTRLSLDAPHREFRRLAHTFNTMMDRLQKVVEGQRRFVADAAHEIQTPLTVLKGNLEVAFRKNRRAAEYRDVLMSNMEAVDRLINLSRSLITLAKLAGDQASPPTHPLAFEPLLRGLIAELAVLAEDHRIALTLDADPVPAVLADEGQMKRLLLNLFGNALRYTSPGGVVSVRLRRDGDGVLIAVRDNGPGIAPEHLPHIFERFYRADSARARDSGGVGLGLAIAKEIVEAHHGRITVESEIGKGTVFTVRLPADGSPGV